MVFSLHEVAQAGPTVWHTFRTFLHPADIFISQDSAVGSTW